MEYANNFKSHGLQYTKVTIQCFQNIEPMSSQSVIHENSLVCVENIELTVTFQNSLQSTSVEDIEYLCVQNIKCEPMAQPVTNENALQRTSVKAHALPVPNCSPSAATQNKQHRVESPSSKHRRVESPVIGKFLLRKFHPGKFHRENLSYGKFLPWKNNVAGNSGMPLSANL